MEGLPLYLQLKDYLENLISRNSLKYGALLPTEKELEKRFGVSRATVRQALAQLEKEGTIKRKQGKGTFVAIPRFRRTSPNLTGFSEDMMARGYQPGSKLLRYRKLSKNRNLTPFGPKKDVVQIVRLRLANDDPVGIQYLYIEKDVADRIGFTPESLKLKRNVSLYRSLEEAGYMIDVANDKISVKPANKFESRYLRVRVGETLFSVHRETMSKNNELLEVADAVYLPNKYEYTVQLKRSIHRRGIKQNLENKRSNFILWDRAEEKLTE